MPLIMSSLVAGIEWAAMSEACILIVDDDEDILGALKDFLSESVSGLRILTASSAAQALETLRREAVDVVITDYAMAPMDGVAFLKRVAKEHPSIVTVMMTAYPSTQVVARGLNEAGIRSFLTKPFQPSDLLEAMQGAIDERRSRVGGLVAVAREFTAAARRHAKQPGSGPAFGSAGLHHNPQKTR